MAQPDKDIATALDNLLAGFTQGTDLFFGPVRPFDETASAVIIPHKAIFCTSLGGPPPTRMFRRPDIRVATVQVRVRGDVGQFEATETIARDVWEKTRDMDVSAGGDLSDYISVFAANSEPIQLGQDNQEHWEFAINVEMTYVQIA